MKKALIILGIICIVALSMYADIANKIYSVSNTGIAYTQIDSFTVQYRFTKDADQIKVRMTYTPTALDSGWYLYIYKDNYVTARVADSVLKLEKIIFNRNRTVDSSYFKTIVFPIDVKDVTNMRIKAVRQKTAIVADSAATLLYLYPMLGE